MRTFDFISLPPRTRKPRSTGVTMVIDKGLGYAALRDLLDIAAPWIDVWKLGWGTTRVQPREAIARKVSLLRDHDISVCNGGTLLELAERQGKVPELFDTLVELGCDTTEISNGTIDIAQPRIRELVGLARDAGLHPVCEVGKKMPEDDLAAEEYAEQLRDCLDAGAEMVIVEARESGASVGLMDASGKVREELLDTALAGVPIERVLFEAPRKPQQVFFIHRFGPEVNLGNIAPDEVIALETLRRGLRGDTLCEFH